MKMKLFMAVLTTVFLSTPVAAQRYNLGLGNTGCEKFVSRLDDTDLAEREKEWYRAAVTAWVQGYVSGRNHEHEKQNQYARTGSSMSGDAMKSWVEDYCRENPSATVDVAGSILYVDLEKKETEVK